MSDQKADRIVQILKDHIFTYCDQLQKKLLELREFVEVNIVKSAAQNKSCHITVEMTSDSLVERKYLSAIQSKGRNHAGPDPG